MYQLSIKYRLGNLQVSQLGNLQVSVKKYIKVQFSVTKLMYISVKLQASVRNKSTIYRHKVNISVRLQVSVR